MARTRGPGQESSLPLWRQFFKMETATTLVFVRHGKTHWNQKGLLQGHLDVDGCQLTDRGREEAHLLGMTLANKKFDAVVSSDLGRALTTARLCLAAMKSQSEGNDSTNASYGTSSPGETTQNLDNVILREPRLRERFLGSLQGKPYSAHTGSPEDFGGETTEALLQRTISCVNEIVTTHAGKTVLVFSHGGTITILLKHMLGFTYDAPANFRIKNTSVSVVKASAIEGETCFRIESMGCTTHLGTF